MIRADGFRHEALLYKTEAEFLSGTTAFIKQGLAEGAPTLVVVEAAKIRRLRAALGADAEAVEFADMVAVGQNPARIIPRWRDFVDRHGGRGRPLRGIGEPVWPGRSPDELVECRHHEALLNVAFVQSPPFWLLCPYDASTLEPVVVEDAHGTHPFVCTADDRQASPDYDGTHPHRLFDEPLPDRPPHAPTLQFTELAPVREFVRRHVETSDGHRDLSDVVLAVDELAANSLRHGGGQGTLAIWWQGDSLVCQVEDRGHIVDPLVGRRRPVPTQLNGRGLWITNQLCRLLQIRSSPQGTRVRIHFRNPTRRPWQRRTSRHTWPSTPDLTRCL
jgi:anti-sigma regulatory factor (Ser/Thr protein kinase)